jgi:hypothetical protein
MSLVVEPAALVFQPVAAVVHVDNSQLQKSPSRNFGQNSGNSVDISKAVFETVIWKFESSQVGVGSRHRSASQAIDLPSDVGGNLGRLFTPGNLSPQIRVVPCVAAAIP